jgi:DNA polymerase-1
VRDATRAFGVSCVEMAGLRGRRPDRDLRAAGARSGRRCTIISSDKDLMQLVVDGKVELLDTMKNRRLASAEVLEKVRCRARQGDPCPGLAGDSIDNVPGVRGIGVKTAAELINSYGDLETLLKRAGEIKQNKRRESLIEQAENARISFKLVTLDSNVPLKEQPDEFACMSPIARS